MTKKAQRHSAKRAAKRAANFDGYVDQLTSSGAAGALPRPWYLPERELDEEELANAYENDAVAARIVDRVVDDAIRTDWHLVGIDKSYDWQSVKSALDDRGALVKIGDAWRWARLQRGALLVMAVDDGQPYDKPLVLEKVKALRGLTVIDAPRVSGVGFDHRLGAESRANPEWYEILDPETQAEVEAVGGQALQRRIHRSRVIRFDGVKVPPRRKLFNNTWGPSVLQRCWRSLANYANVQRNGEAIMRRISVVVLKMKGWRAAACGKPAEREKLRQAMRELWWAFDNFNMIPLDADDNFEEVKRSIEGVKAMMDAAVNDLVMASDTSRLIITGEQTATGLNSDVKGERHAWFDRVVGQRGEKVTPALTRVLEIEFAARRNKGEQVPDEYWIEYDPLEQEAQEDTADRATKWSSVVSMMIDKKVITPAQAQVKLVNEGILERTELDGAVRGGVDPNFAAEIVFAVAAKTMPVASAMWLLELGMADGADRSAMQAAVQAAAMFGKPQGAAANPGQPETLDDPGEVEEPSEPDPLDLALGTLAKDYMSPEDLVLEVKSRLGLTVSTQLIHALARKYKARVGKVGGERGYSAADIKAALLQENGLEVPASKEE